MESQPQNPEFRNNADISQPWMVTAIAHLIFGTGELKSKAMPCASPFGPGLGICYGKLSNGTGYKKT